MYKSSYMELFGNYNALKVSHLELEENYNLTKAKYNRVMTETRKNKLGQLYTLRTLWERRVLTGKVLLEEKSFLGIKELSEKYEKSLEMLAITSSEITKIEKEDNSMFLETQASALQRSEERLYEYIEVMISTLKEADEHFITICYPTLPKLSLKDLRIKDLDQLVATVGNGFTIVHKIFCMKILKILDEIGYFEE